MRKKRTTICNLPEEVIKPDFLQEIRLRKLTKKEQNDISEYIEDSYQQIKQKYQTVGKDNINNLIFEVARYFELQKPDQKYLNFIIQHCKKSSNIQNDDFSLSKIQKICNVIFKVNREDQQQRASSTDRQIQQRKYSDKKYDSRNKNQQSASIDQMSEDEEPVVQQIQTRRRGVTVSNNRFQQVKLSPIRLNRQKRLTIHLKEQSNVMNSFIEKEKINIKPCTCLPVIKPSDACPPCLEKQCLFDKKYLENCILYKNNRKFPTLFSSISPNKSLRASVQLQLRNSIQQSLAF